MHMKGLDIKSFIDRVGISSKEELAEMLGVTPQTVSNWIKGRKFPAHETEQQLLEMGMTVEELFGKPYTSKIEKATVELDSESKEALKRLVRQLGI